VALPVELSAKAKADIVWNASWWARNHSLLEALEWEETVIQQCNGNGIGNAPENYSPVSANVDGAAGLREALVGKGRRKAYRAIFRIEPHRVVVVRLFGGEQDESAFTDLRQ
jgi:hypothetical protein